MLHRFHDGGPPLFRSFYIHGALHMNLATSLIQYGRPSHPNAFWGGIRCYDRGPKIALPMRTIVLPSSIATSKSLLMPIESSSSATLGVLLV